MIYDSMRAFQKYKGISPETWSKITGFLDSISGTVPEASSTRLDGDKLIANVVHTNTRDFESGKYESHRRYVDIHIPLRAGTDTALAMAMLNVIISEELYDAEFVDLWCYGFEQFAEWGLVR